MPCDAVSMLTKFRVNADGTETVLWSSAKPYELRRGRGMSVYAPLLRFSRRKPRYRRVGTLLVMVRSRKAA